ncbi:MAG: Pls/PosA family non-ribosomal peptide synthetase, partial [Pseudolysinimonas sp.]
ADNFFDLGGGSLAAAQLVALLRLEDPGFTVAEVYARPRLRAMADLLDSRAETARTDDHEFHRVEPTPLRMQWLQTLLGIPLFILSGLRWLLYILLAGTLLRPLHGFDVLPSAPLAILLIGIAVFASPFGGMLIAAGVARLLLAGVGPGDYPRGGSVHLRLWLAEQAGHLVGGVSLVGAPWITTYARLLGARIDRDVDMHTLPPITGLLTVRSGASIEPEVDLSGYWIDGDTVRIGAIRIGADATIGARSTLLPGARIGKGAEIAPGSAVFGRVPSGQLWAGSPAQREGASTNWFPAARPPRGRGWLIAYALSAAMIALAPVLALACGGVVIASAIRFSGSLGEAALRAAGATIPATLLAGLVFGAIVVGFVRLLGVWVREGVYPIRGPVGWAVWSTERLLDLSRVFLFPLYSSQLTPMWLRLLGARVGKNVEASTVLLLPTMTTIRDGAFLADDTMLGSYELGGGWVRVGRSDIGKRAFIGNSGMAAAGHTVPRDGLVAVLSAAPQKSKAGSSWLGSPPVRLRRTVAAPDDDGRTFNPYPGLRAARALWELCRVIPTFVSCGIGLGVLFTLAAVTETAGIAIAVLVSGIVMLAAGAVAAGITTTAKWLFVGRIRVGEHPLWSSFVWRTEVSDTFVELVAAPWFAQAAAGTPALNLWLRSLGASIGRGVWCDTYWLPEPDLARLGDGATVNRGCVVQTHLFHDRIMSMDTVTLAAGATLGPHSVILPAAVIGEHGTVGPASLVMRGEHVPIGSRWSGNPIGPWREVRTADYHSKVR